MSVKMVAVAVLAAGPLARPASAQVLKGSFALSHEVHWGGAVLSAGAYSITMDSLRGPALVTTADGRGRCLVLAAHVDSAIQGQATGLLITRVEGERTVSSFNWREGGRNFVYRPLPKGRSELLASTRGVEPVPIVMSRK